MQNFVAFSECMNSNFQYILMQTYKKLIKLGQTSIMGCKRSANVQNPIFFSKVLKLQTHFVKGKSQNQIPVKFLLRQDMSVVLFFDY